ncbi:alpha/beta hydrolase-fold protein [Yinghuangia sp. YIM S09857]|uniref:alpha/beta hydrolase-fold protein n=1 Tax=Yinghuangia sp. YIM S09857 TaxID=3436929 RepID=UPI003F532B0F
MRKALKALLIATTTGFAVAYLLRTQGTKLRRRTDDGPRPEQTAPPGDFAEEATVRPVLATPRDDDTPLSTPVAAAAEVRPARHAPGREPQLEQRHEARHEARHDQRHGQRYEQASEIVEIDPDRLTPLAVIGPEPERPARTRRPQLVVGGVTLAFVLVAGAVGTLAYDSLKGDDDGDKTAPAAAGTSEAASPRPSASSTDGDLAPLGPQQFQSLGTRSGGQLNHLELAGRRSGVTSDVWVWLPPQYTQESMRTKSFPVLVVHSAYPGVGANSMLEPGMGLLADLTDGITSGTLPPFVVVAPELTPYQQNELSALADPTEIDTECSDIPGKPSMATFHNEDVREAVAATFRVSADRASWGLLGEGAGGLCATKYALQYGQYYAASASLSGPLELTSPLWPSASGVRDAQQPKALLAKKPDVRVFLSNTSSATAARQDATAFKSAAKAPTVVENATASGTVSKQLPAALQFLGRNVTDSTEKSPSSASATATGAGTGATSTRRP